MVKYAVALDDNSISQASFKVALRHAIPNKGDRLLLVSIVDKVRADPNEVDTSFAQSKQHRLVNEAHVLLLRYGQEAAAKGVDCEIVVAAAENPAQELCKIVQNLKVDVLLMGRHHAPSMFTKFFGDSTLNFCIDNAPCNVLIVNNEYEAPSLRRRSLLKSSEVSAAKKVTTPKTVTPKVLTPVKPRKASVAEVKPVAVKEHEVVVVEQTEEEEESSDFVVRRQKTLPLVRQMEEDERARRVGIIEKERLASRKSEARDRKINSQLAVEMEKDERNLRIGDHMIASLENRDNRIQSGKQAHKAERHERFLRMKEAHDADRETRKLRAAAKVRALELEEVARKEKLQICAPNLIDSFAEVRARYAYTKDLEEQERHRRVMLIEQDDQFAKSYEEEASLLDLKMTKMLEELERKSRTSQPSEAKLARQESQTDLSLVKKLEEGERERRIREEVPAMRAMF